MPIQINQTFIQLGINTIPGKMQLSTSQPRLELHREDPQLDIRTQQAVIVIDQYECFATSGLKSSGDLTRDFAQRGCQSALEFTSKTASDGTMLAAIENGGNPIRQIAVRDAYPTHEFGLDYMPKARPKISVSGGINVNVETNSEGAMNGVTGNFTPGDFKLSYTPADVRIFVSRYNSINISNAGSSINVSI
jgi:hypothetical protein